MKLFLMMAAVMSVCSISSAQGAGTLEQRIQRMERQNQLQQTRIQELDYRLRLLENGNLPIPAPLPHEVCTLKFDGYQYSIEKNGAAITAKTTYLSTVVTSWQSLIKAGLCSDYTGSVCDMKFDGYQYYLTQDGKQITAKTSYQSTALETLTSLRDNKICR